MWRMESHSFKPARARSVLVRRVFVICFFLETASEIVQHCEWHTRRVVLQTKAAHCRATCSNYTWRRGNVIFGGAPLHLPAHTFMPSAIKVASWCLNLLLLSYRRWLSLNEYTSNIPTLTHLPSGKMSTYECIVIIPWACVTLCFYCCCFLEQGCFWFFSSPIDFSYL